MPTVLERKEPLTVLTGSPAEKSLRSLRRRRDRQLAAKLASRRVDDYGGVRLSMRIDPNYDHARSPFWEVATGGAPADAPQWGRLATLLSGHAGAPLTRRRATQRTSSQTSADRRLTGQPAAAHQRDNDTEEAYRSRQQACAARSPAHASSCPERAASLPARSAPKTALFGARSSSICNQIAQQSDCTTGRRFRR